MVRKASVGSRFLLIDDEASPCCVLESGAVVCDHVLVEIAPYVELQPLSGSYVNSGRRAVSEFVKNSAVEAEAAAGVAPMEKNRHSFAPSRRFLKGFCS
ncbi:hypothetical protein Aduo_008496 [Ancylostoma duodenale]